MNEDEKMITIYTTAPKDYDGFGTRTVDEEVGELTGGRRQQVRRVEVAERHVLWQRSRYGSGLHLAASEEQWREMLEMKLAVAREGAGGRDAI